MNNIKFIANSDDYIKTIGDVKYRRFKCFTDKFLGDKKIKYINPFTMRNECGLWVCFEDKQNEVKYMVLVDKLEDAKSFVIKNAGIDSYNWLLDIEGGENNE